MLVRPNTRHHQTSYVTRDLDAALNIFRVTYGVERFFELPGIPGLRVALANVGGNEIEIIEPQPDGPPLYKDVLKPDPATGRVPPLIFHHVAMRIDGTLDDWERHRASIDETVHPIAIEGAIEDKLRFIYTDERARLGHYLEHVWMSESLVAEMNGAVPHY